MKNHESLPSARAQEDFLHSLALNRTPTANILINMLVQSSRGFINKPYLSNKAESHPDL
jgi:hypothetical protein